MTDTHKGYPQRTYDSEEWFANVERLMDMYMERPQEEVNRETVDFVPMLEPPPHSQESFQEKFKTQRHKQYASTIRINPPVSCGLPDCIGMDHRPGLFFCTAEGTEAEAKTPTVICVEEISDDDDVIVGDVKMKEPKQAFLRGDMCVLISKAVQLGERAKKDEPKHVVLQSLYEIDELLQKMIKRTKNLPDDY